MEWSLYWTILSQVILALVLLAFAVSVFLTLVVGTVMNQITRHRHLRATASNSLFTGGTRND